MKRNKILIIDDDHHIANGARVRLSAAGYDTIVAHDGPEGIEAAMQAQPDAVVLDVRMPTMDGLAAMDRLRQDPATNRIPVVMLSASIVDEKAALNAGARFFIRKPFSGDTLIEAINYVTTDGNA